jgi:hypothetical protein
MQLIVALIPLMLEATGVPFQLTIGWSVRDGKPIFQRGEDTIRHFVTDKLSAWQREGCFNESPGISMMDSGKPGAKTASAFADRHDRNLRGKI